MGNDIVLVGNHSTRAPMLKDVHFYVYHIYHKACDKRKPFTLKSIAKIINNRVNEKDKEFGTAKERGSDK